MGFLEFIAPTMIGALLVGLVAIAVFFDARR